MMAQKLRLVCPNCTAQYEVDESVIPEAGRDVQCSNCGHTWWQLRSGPAADADGEPSGTVAEAPAAAAGEEPGGGSPAAPEPMAPGAEVAEIETPMTDDGASASARLHDDDRVDEAQPVPQQQPEDAHGDAHGAEAADDRGIGEGSAPRPEPALLASGMGADDDGPALAAALAGTPGAALPQRRSLDEAVLDVLREEAEREVGARRSETATAATPATPDPALAGTDLGRGQGEREVEVRARMASLDQFEEIEVAGQPRRERHAELPDLATINSTWDGKADADGDVAAADAAVRRRSGFRNGFGLTLLIAAGLALVYVYADQIAARAPALEASVTSYRESVDRARVWLDSAALNASSSLEGEAPPP